MQAFFFKNKVKMCEKRVLSQLKDAFFHTINRIVERRSSNLLKMNCNVN